MGIISFARNKAFWFIDSVRGSSIRNAYNDIKMIDEMDSDNPFIKKYQQQAWKKLKKEACTKTKVYASYKDCDFVQFPVISKQDIRQFQDDYISSDFRKEDLIQMSTSGSTGTPFISYQNGGKKRRVNAEIIYYSEKVGYKLGNNLSYIRTIVKQNKKSKWKQFAQNQTLINCGQLNDEGVEKLLIAIQKQSKKGPVTLLGYGSTYTAIKDYIIKKGIKKLQNYNINGVISGSDMLFDETREVISNVFGDIVMVSRYSNEENGVLGQDEGINNVFVINEANYIIEIVDESGNSVPDGTLGRIVVTDLFNYAMPMIRYDTGDIGAIQMFNINGKKKRCICQFSGRQVDVIFDVDGNALSPHMITNNMWSFPEIIQFQLIQVDKMKYVLKLNVSENFNRQLELIDTLKKVVGIKAQILVERVEEIPILASGKRRYIVNEWKK